MIHCTKHNCIGSDIKSLPLFFEGFLMRVHSLKKEKRLNVLQITTWFIKSFSAQGMGFEFYKRLNKIYLSVRWSGIGQWLKFQMQHFLCSPGLVSPEVLAAFACSDPQLKTVFVYRSLCLTIHFAHRVSWIVSVLLTVCYLSVDKWHL